MSIRKTISSFRLTQIALLIAVTPLAASAQCVQGIYHDGEILRYAVRWSIFRLGTIEIRQRLMDRTGQRFELLLRVRSAPHLPFIDVSFDNRSEQHISQHGLRHEIITTASDTTEYRYDAGTRAYVTEDRTMGVVTRRDTVRHPFPLFDALGLFMIARCLSIVPVDTTLPTLLEHACYATDLRTLAGRETILVEAFAESRPAVMIEGFAHWVGNSYAGLTGAFRGWISDDAMAVPLRAELEIFLGSIVLELESLERPGKETIQNASHQLTQPYEGS